MRACPRAKDFDAFTRRELLAVILVTAVAAMVLFSALARQRQRALRLRCINNLAQVGVAFQTWALDNGDRFPMAVEAEHGGSLEAAAPGEAFRYFQVMSNELLTPKPLICPADVRVPATDFGPGLSNTNLSYFVGIDAVGTDPQMFLSGDRNLTNGTALQNGILQLTPSRPAGWTHELHNRIGNLGLADGSVQQFTTARLGTAGGTNRLAMP